MLSFGIVYRCFWYQFDGHYTKQYFWHHVHLCWGPFLGVFLGLFLCSSISFCSSIFYHEIVYSSTLKATWPKNMSCSPLLGAFLGYFWVHVNMCCCISWKPFNIFSWNFVGITLMVTTLTKEIIKNFSDDHVLLYCQTILAFVPLFLENHSIFSDENVYRCSWYYSDGQFTFLNIMSILAGDHFFWIFGPIFLCSSISRELYNVLSWNCVQMCLVVVTWWSLHRNKCHVHLCWLPFWGILGPMSAMFLCFLRTIQYILMNFCRYYSDGHYTNKKIIKKLFFSGHGLILAYICSSISWKLFNIFS